VKKVILILFFFNLNIFPAIGLELQGSLTQGALIIGKAPIGSVIFIDGRKLRVDPEDGVFAFGFGRDHSSKSNLKIIYPDNRIEIRTLLIKKREWNIERIDGLPPKKVSPPKSMIIRIKRESEILNNIRSRDTTNVNFLDGFIIPAKGRFSGHYGSQRILNGKLRRPHLGLDIAGPIGTPIYASASGQVVFTASDLFYTGGTIVIDHGHGITTIYSHMNSIKTEVGEYIEQGKKIGTMGTSGRATGSHLDWRINWFNIRLDPELILVRSRKN
jgi:murein DD-endopeptidase MepM/ murein hydrolase activator NlpD